MQPRPAIGFSQLLFSHQGKQGMRRERQEETESKTEMETEEKNALTLTLSVSHFPQRVC
jgi:hypothetical protein